MLSSLQNDLANLADRGRQRSLIAREGKDFSSNDYLGLAHAPRLRQAVADALARGVSVGSGGSRLLRGNDPEHEMLEQEAARFFGCESAMFLPNGFTANMLLLSTMPQRGDRIFYDSLVHASAHEGMRISRADHQSVPHSDADAFGDAIAAWRQSGGIGTPWIVVESLYSMDGDSAPLASLAEVADRHEAMLVIDEAHATGVFGPDGRGLAHFLDGRENVITLHTCGKGLGCEGALVTGPAIMREFLINRGRAFIFSTAPSPLMASAVRESLRILADEPERRSALQTRITAAESALASIGVQPTGSQILPLVLGDDHRTMRVARAIQNAGMDVRGIRPPTVPAGTARLRISLTLNVEPEDIVALADIIKEAL